MFDNEYIIDIVKDFTILERKINTNPIIKDSIEKILDAHMKNNEWKLDYLNTLLGPCIGEISFIYYLYTLPDADNYLYNELIDGGLSKEFVDWIIKLALIYGTNIWESSVRERKSMDWKSVTPKLIVKNKTPGLNITITRHDREQFVLEGNRSSYLNLIGELTNLLTTFSEPLSNLETETIDQMLKDLLSFSEKHAQTESDVEES